jgi:hypothetical protein
MEGGGGPATSGPVGGDEDVMDINYGNDLSGGGMDINYGNQQGSLTSNWSEEQKQKLDNYFGEPSEENLDINYG